MKRLVFVIFMLASPAFAQQQPQAPANVRALSDRLLAEIGSGVQCSTSLISANDKIAALEAELQKLKQEPPK